MMIRLDSKVDHYNPVIHSMIGNYGSLEDCTDNQFVRVFIKLDGEEHGVTCYSVLHASS